MRARNAEKDQLQSTVFRRQQLLKRIETGPDPRHDRTHEQEVDPCGVLTELADARVVVSVDFFGNDPAHDVGCGPPRQGHHGTHEEPEGVHRHFFQAQEFADHDVIQLRRHNHGTASEQTEGAEFGELRQIAPIDSLREAGEEADTRAAHQQERDAV